MAENITTVLDKPSASSISLDDIIYLIQGIGSNRDKKATLRQIRDFLSECIIAVNENDHAPGYLASKFAKWQSGSGYTDGDVQFEVADSRAGADTVLKAHIVNSAVKSSMIADGAVTSSKMDDEIEIADVTKKIKFTPNGFYVYSGSTMMTLNTDKLELDVLQGNSHSLIGIYFNVIAGRLEATDFAVEQLSEKTEGEGINVSGALNCDDVNVEPGSTLTAGAGGDATIINGGNVGATGVITANKVHAATYRANEIISASSAYSLAQQEGDSHNPLYGDIVFIRNTGTADIGITIVDEVMHGTGTKKSVQLSPGCCVGFICVAAAAASTKSAWAPMSNMTVTTENVAQ
ncbi:MAG: hypothetical protein J6U20_03795 [Fibrobacter sp.]|nr:hypothetical protein [Fibrobacter sp.]